MGKKRSGFKKRRAIYLLAACQMDEGRVAQELGVKRSTVMRWLRDPDFANRLEAHIDRIEFHDSRYRAQQGKMISGALYDEINRRIVDGESLKNVSLPVLVSTNTSSTKFRTAMKSP